MSLVDRNNLQLTAYKAEYIKLSEKNIISEIINKFLKINLIYQESFKLVFEFFCKDLQFLYFKWLISNQYVGVNLSPHRFGWLSIFLASHWNQPLNWSRFMLNLTMKTS